MKKETRYELTPLGVIGEKPCNKLILFFVKSSKYNAIVFDGKQLTFSEVQKVEPTNKKRNRKKCSVK